MDATMAVWHKQNALQTSAFKNVNVGANTL
jgi:hypothetical protein